METESIAIKCEYSDHELASLGGEISRALSNKATIEAEFDGVKADFKARISGQQALITSLSARINNRFEMRTVNCLILDERDNGHRLLVRSDTGHVTRRRKLAPHERQAALPLDGPAPEFFVTVELENDDLEWTTVSAVVSLYEDEYAQIRDLPDVRKVIVVDSVEDPAKGPDYCEPQDETEVPAPSKGRRKKG